MMNVIKICAASFLLLALAGPALCAPAALPTSPEEALARERTARELNVELNRLGSSGDPVEREAVLRRIVEQCAGVEEAEAAHWSLTDLYLDAFSEPREEDARDVLERFLKQYPNSRWTTQAKCRLLALCDAKGDRAAQLRRELSGDDALPQALRAAIRGSSR